MNQWIRKTDAADHMREVTKSGVTYLTFPVLDATGIVTHAFSTRMGGVSEGWYSTMNFSFTRGDNREHVLENYSRMAAALGVDREKMVLTWQTHTTNIRVVSADDLGKGVVKDRDYRDIDGLLTNMPGVTLVTFFADCVPLYFVDPKHHAIGLAHSGWRGTVNRMGEKMIHAMKQEYGTVPEDLICCVGPSICSDCYEVGEDVADNFRDAFSKEDCEHIVFPSKSGVIGKRQLDLWEANRRILMEAAIYSDKVAVDEETVRLHSHVAQLRAMLESGGVIGRKADFLIQELNREANTIGSKCCDIAISESVIALKAEIEKIREQIQNVE